MRMVDVGSKPAGEREAVARGRIRVSPETLERVKAGAIEKGDPCEAARLAAIMAVKRTPELIPLCHPLSISGADARVELEPAGLCMTVSVRACDRTGVEMEALTAVAIGCLTIYDMLKKYEPGMTIESVELLSKVGGKSGRWVRG